MWTTGQYFKREVDHLTATNLPAFPDAFTIDPHAPGAFVNFVHQFKELLHNLEQHLSPLVILCIGSDRSTGDALGPLAGSMLTAMNLKDAVVYGTLEEPVHALNLEKTCTTITAHHRNSAILAVDSSLGSKKNVGCLQFGMGSLRPGAGVHKKLPPVGDIYVTGIVNMGGFMELMVLQSTRLGTVFPLARFISRGIMRAFSLTNNRHDALINTQ